jgi:hypothetical protein
VDDRPGRPDRHGEHGQHHGAGVGHPAQLEQVHLPDCGFANGLVQRADLWRQAAGLPGKCLRRVHYLGAHINACWDINSRFEWYWDQDGGGYPGGFGVPNTTYFEVTVGPDYHPVKWLQFRPEIRYDWANHDNFGSNNDKKTQLSIAAELLIKF